jgi:hypothetical protein
MIFFVHVDIIFSLVVLARQGQKDGGMEKGGAHVNANDRTKRLPIIMFFYIYIYETCSSSKHK